MPRSMGKSKASPDALMYIMSIALEYVKRCTKTSGYATKYGVIEWCKHMHRVKREDTMQALVELHATGQIDTNDKGYYSMV